MKKNHKKARKVVVVQQPKPQPSTHFKKYEHPYLLGGTILVAISALLFGFESWELSHQLEVAGFSGAIGAFAILLATW